MVCETFHDEGRLNPVCSSANKFVTWLEANHWEWGSVDIEDEDFGVKIFAQAKALLKNGRLDESIPVLERACASFPEDGDYWLTLAGQYRRRKQREDSVRCALNAYRANWAFGRPAAGVYSMLQAAAKEPAFASDPVIRRMPLLSGKFGGTKTNDNYDLLRACVDDYFDMGQPLAALQVYQNYAYAMYFETTAFQDRCQFSVSAWRDDFAALCLQHLGDDRRTMA
jgi:tetratricopeptide (TPR) repeat protein